MFVYYYVYKSKRAQRVRGRKVLYAVFASEIEHMLDDRDLGPSDSYMAVPGMSYAEAANA
jgi:hypothetical protein